MTQDEELIKTHMSISEAREKYGRREFDESDPRPVITTKLHVTGMNLSVEECTCRVGLQPLESCGEAVITGTRVPSGEPYVREPYWRVGFKDQRSYSTDDEMVKLLDLIWPRREALLAYLADTGCTGTFTIGVTIHQDRPVYELRGETLNRLGYLGLDWGLDVFDFSE